MFFIISKIFWFIVMPLNFIALAGLAGFVLKKCSFHKSGNILLYSAISLFLIFGFLPIGYNALVFLERQYDRPIAMPEKVHGIIMLGGSFNSRLYKETGMVTAGVQVSRALDFVNLAYQYPEAKLVFSGGSGQLLPTERTEADDMAHFLGMVQFDVGRVQFESQSRNSYENIKFSKKLVQPQKGETWILVTSRFHLPRVMGGR